MTALRRSVLTALAGAMAAALLFSLATAYDARAGHEPAMKGAAAGSDLDEIDQQQPDLILSETMRVSSPEDLIIQVTSECSILTSLLTQGSGTAGSTSTANTFGQVELYVTIDGKRVPVATDDLDDEDEGKVVFCNRAYQRTITDTEDDPDGTDTERDFIRTRTANAFNWVALDTGFDYDDPANGKNILSVELWAEYTATNAPNTCPTASGTEATCSEAFVGSRTMVIEPLRVSIHEQVNRDDATGGN